MRRNDRIEKAALTEQLFNCLGVQFITAVSPVITDFYGVLFRGDR